MPTTAKVDHSKRRLFTLPKAALKPMPIQRNVGRPPYAVEEDILSKLCDGCGQCTLACSKGLISIEQGLPALDLSYGACDLCQQCQQACPTVALSSSIANTGLIAKVSNTCENINGYCTSCEDSCRHEALIWSENSLPEINDSCLGCGECTESCFISAIQMTLNKTST